MGESFDPYLKWLGIRTSGRRVNHYRLLGLDLYEADVDVIANAAGRQIGHVESFAAEHPVEAKKVLGQLKAARDCLLSEELKKRYDKKLRNATPAKQPSPPQAAGSKAGTVDLPDSQSQPDFSGLQIGSSQGPVDSAPKIRAASRRPRRQKSFDIAGWILGAIGAVAFAYVLLNTNLIDVIKGRAPREVAKAESPDAVEENAESAKTSGLTAPPKSKPKPIEPTDATESVEPPPVGSPRPRNENVEPLPTKNTPPPASIVKPQPVPSAADLESARRDFQQEYKLHLSERDVNVMRVLANKLVSRIDNESTPEVQFVRLTKALELAGNSGDFQTIQNAATQLQKRFVGFNYWEEIQEPVAAALATSDSLEPIVGELDLLFERARMEQQWKICSDFSIRAAKLADKSGDRLQQDMLQRFAKDMKSMDALQRKCETLGKKDVGKLSTKEKFELGRYLCFSKQNTKQGLKLISEGNDTALAAVAMSDLESFEDSNNSFEVAQAWAKLSKKSKYKRMDRRFMLERALQRIDESRESISSPDAEQATSEIIDRIAILKRYSDFNLLRNKTVVFEVKGFATFDQASLENGMTLRLGLGSRTRKLPVRMQDQVGIARTLDNLIRFELRRLESGMVEMKMYEKATNVLRNVLYGK